MEFSPPVSLGEEVNGALGGRAAGAAELAGLVPSSWRLVKPWLWLGTASPPALAGAEQRLLDVFLKAQEGTAALQGVCIICRAFLDVAPFLWTCLCCSSRLLLSSVLWGTSAERGRRAGSLHQEQGKGKSC